MKKLFKKKDRIKLDVPINKDKLKVKEGICAWAMISPTLILFIVFTLVPLIMAIYLSFTNYDLFYDFSFAGKENYDKVFTGVIGKTFWNSIKNILVFAIMSVPMNVIGSLLIANLINCKLKGMKIFRFIFYLPAITSGVATAFCWKWLFSYNNGFFNQIITNLGGTRIDWLGSFSYLPMFAIAIISTWGALGGNMLIYLASLKGINPDLYEAAELDGASAWKKFIHITIPSVRPTTFFIVTMSLIGAFQLFDTVYFVASSSQFTQTPVLIIYETAFKRFEGGIGSAMSVILFLIIMVVTFTVQRSMKEKS